MRRLLLVLIALLAVMSCGHNDNRLAARYLDMAAKCFEDGDYVTAKLYIDSVRTEYPNAFEVRKKGIRLLQKVEIAEADRTIAYQDSALNVLREKFEKVRDSFVFQKDEQYQDLGLFTVSSQDIEKNIGRNYLRGQVDEKGRLTIVSTYCGSSYIHHRSIRISPSSDVDGGYVDTPASDDFYEFKDLGTFYEKCNFTGSTADAIAGYIALHQEENLTVTISGDRSFSYRMQASDSKALANIHSLYLLLSSIDEAKTLRDEAERRKKFVEMNIAKSDSAAAAGR